MEIDRLNLLRKKYTICNTICYSIAIILNILFVILCKREIISLSFSYYFVLPFIVIFSLVFAGLPGQKYVREYTLLYKNYFVYIGRLDYSVFVFGSYALCSFYNRVNSSYMFY